jgi:hypothetical protein
MSAYTSFFLNTDSSVVPLDTMVISHPSFSKTYYIVRNAIDGITATLEDSTTHTFDYYPLSLKQTGSSDDLDQKLEIQLGDLGEVVPQEIDACFNAGSLKIKPTLVFRVFRSDDLSAPIEGPYMFQISSLGTKSDATGFTAEAPRLNSNRTGEMYSLDRFTPLAGFL